MKRYHLLDQPAEMDEYEQGDYVKYEDAIAGMHTAQHAFSHLLIEVESARKREDALIAQNKLLVEKLFELTESKEVTAVVAGYAELEADILAYLERGHLVGKSTAVSRCVTGEPYVTLSCGGLKPEGEPHRVAATDVEKAAELFKAEFDKYAMGKDGVLYWRRKPSVSIDGQHYRITARLVISNKPVMTDAELQAAAIG